MIKFKLFKLGDCWYAYGMNNYLIDFYKGQELPYVRDIKYQKVKRKEVEQVWQMVKDGFTEKERKRIEKILKTP